MTPKQFHITAAKTLHRFKVSRLQTGIVYTYSERVGAVPECTYDISVFLDGSRYIYVNVTSDAKKNPHLTIQNALDWCERQAKEDETVLRNYKIKEDVNAI